MKKILLTVLLFTLSLFIFSSCGEGGLFCKHEYTETVKPATCEAQGEKTKTCTLCGKVKVTTIARKIHEFSAWQDTAEASCTEDGESKRICSACGTEEKKTLEKLGHSFGEYKTVIESSDVQNGLMEKECERCGLTESKIIQSLNFADTTLFLIEFDEGKTYTVNSKDMFFDYCSAAVFNRSAEVKMTVDFEHESLDSLIDDLVDSIELPFPFQVSAGLLGKSLTLTFTYPDEPTKTTDAASPYVQRASVSYQPITAVREANYDGFKINDSAVSYKVSTSEQLYYALECRVKPLPVAGSTAERIYGKMKTVLRSIISDDMDDFEKARAIYDWLIMNVIYDGELYDLLTGGGSVDSGEYNGFYLEGVFDDGFAVCDGISKAFTALANIEGIPCVQVSGRQTGNLTGVGHAWNKIYLDGKWYIVDATSGGIIVNKEYEVHSLQFFLVTDAEMLKRYTGENHTSLVCNSVYDPFKAHKFTYNDTEYDLYIESQNELNVLMKYFSEFSQSGITVQFEIAEGFNVGASLNDELQTACLFAGVNVSSSLTDGENGRIITLW